jgi:hypothetical protein
MGDASTVRRAVHPGGQTGLGILIATGDKEIVPSHTWLELAQSPRAFPAPYWKAFDEQKQRDFGVFSRLTGETPDRGA